MITPPDKFFNEINISFLNFKKLPNEAFKKCPQRSNSRNHNMSFDFQNAWPGRKLQLVG